MLKIACHPVDSEPDSPVFGPRKENGKLTCNDLLQDSINCARECAFEAITELLWEHPTNALRFKLALKNSVEDENPAVLFAVLHCAAPWYNIDKDFSKAVFDRLLDRDLRVLGARQARDFLCRFYKSAPEFYAGKLQSACQSSISDLKKCAAEMAATLVIMGHWTLADIMSLPLTEQQADAVCRQAVIHFNYEEAHTYCEQLLLCLADRGLNLQSLSLLFHKEYLQITRDRNFLMKLLEIECPSTIAWDVLRYLKETDVDSNAYAELLFAVCKSFSNSTQNIFPYRIDDLMSCVARLFRAGRDEPEVLRTCLDIWDNIYYMYPLSVQPLADLLDRS